MASDTQTAENKDVVSRFYEGIDEHNLNIFDDLLAADYTTGIYRTAAEQSTVTGREGMKQLREEYWAAFPDLIGTATELIAEGERVAVFREEIGTHEDVFRGIPPTGNEVTFEYGGYFIVEDGQITHGHLRGNMLDLLRQLGVDSPIPE